MLHFVCVFRLCLSTFSHMIVSPVLYQSQSKNNWFIEVSELIFQNDASNGPSKQMFKRQMELMKPRKNHGTHCWIIKFILLNWIQTHYSVYTVNCPEKMEKFDLISLIFTWKWEHLEFVIVNLIGVNPYFHDNWNHKWTWIWTNMFIVRFEMIEIIHRLFQVSSFSFDISVSGLWTMDCGVWTCGVLEYWI